MIKIEKCVRDSERVRSIKDKERKELKRLGMSEKCVRDSERVRSAKDKERKELKRLGMSEN